MSSSLFSAYGQRKYLTASERSAFISMASKEEADMAAFCLTLALTGARLSEVLQFKWDRIDFGNEVLVLETLKRRRRGVFRAIPVPKGLLNRFATLRDTRECGVSGMGEVWAFSRTTAWREVRRCLLRAGVPVWLAKPKSLRHAFGVQAVQKRIALNVVKKWLGHAKIETTAIYAEPLGAEERALARLLWK